MLALARGFLSGEIALIAVARELHGFRDGVDAEIARLIDVYVAIVSETDALPTGEERTLWNAEALVRQAELISAAEQRWRDSAVAAAMQLVSLLERDSYDDTFGGVDDRALRE